MALSPELCERHTILKVLAGSHIHGLNVEGSDRDEEAIVIEPIDVAWRIGMPWEETIRESDTIDIKYVSLRKWTRLALGGNPNFLLPLFAPQSAIISMTSLGGQLREMRDKLLSKQSIKSHLGYLNNQRNRLLKAESNDGRGKPRQDLTAQFGYDTKFAMHLLRLGMQGLELATYGKITLPMAEYDRNYLLRVRRGVYTLNTVLDFAANLELSMKAAFDTSLLPEWPATEEVERWMQARYIGVWSAQRSARQSIEDHEMFGRGCGTDLGSL